MIIPKDIFMQEIKKLSDLSGQRISERVAEALYHKLKESNINDFMKACESMAWHSDKKISLGNIYTAISFHAAERREIENNERQRREQAQAAQWWKENKQYVDQGHCDRKCIKCPVKYCKIIHDHSISAMRALIDGTKTLDQVNTEMNNKFQGWNTGFDTEPF